MAKFKPQFRRLIFIDSMIRRGSYPNCGKLAREYEVTGRTIARDIEYMRDMLDAPIEYDKNRRGYYYTEPRYMLPAMELSESDLFALCIAEKALAQYAGTPLYTELDTVFTKIASFIPESTRVSASWLSENYSFLPDFSSKMDLSVWETLAVSLRALTAISIEHRKASGEYTRRTVRPYHIAAFRGEWYLVAFCEMKNAVLLFAISRIETATTTSARYAIPDDFDFNAYMGANFGIMAEAEEYTARIRFGPAQAPYVRERIWHRSQRIEEHDDGSVVLTITTNSHMEVKRWVLSWGAGAKVLEPERLAAEVREELREALGMY